MGTLSGGGKEVISLGERCLLGANSGIGISLGDDCVVEAGLYVTAGTKLIFQSADRVEEIKAKQITGESGILFRRNSRTGVVEALQMPGKHELLNAQLHG